jgi:hypothetical protein
MMKALESPKELIQAITADIVETRSNHRLRHRQEHLLIQVEDVKIGLVIHALDPRCRIQEQRDV